LPGQGFQDRAARIRKPDRTERRRQPEKGSQNRTANTGERERDRQNKTAIKKRTSRRTARTGLLGQSCQDRAAAQNC
jgi:hypothetical protein